MELHATRKPNLSRWGKRSPSETAKRAAAARMRAADRLLHGKIKSPPTLQPMSAIRQEEPSDSGSGPVRWLMRAGKWLVPEAERPKLKPIESLPPITQAPFQPRVWNKRRDVSST